jgi:hypothetical protein
MTDPITAEALYPRWAHFIEPDDVVIAETGTCSMGLAFTQLPPKARFYNQTLWGAIRGAAPAALGAAVAGPWPASRAHHRRRLAPTHRTRDRSVSPARLAPSYVRTEELRLPHRTSSCARTRRSPTTTSHNGNMPSSPTPWGAKAGSLPASPRWVNSTPRSPPPPPENAPPTFKSSPTPTKRHRCPGNTTKASPPFYSE